MRQINGSELHDLPLFSDDRGSFGRLFDDRLFSSINNVFFRDIVNINHSVNKHAGTVRGLHMQAAPNQEGKIIICIKGSIVDLYVDANRHSPSFGTINSLILNSKQPQGLLVPRGCLHAFLTLEDMQVITLRTIIIVLSQK